MNIQTGDDILKMQRLDDAIKDLEITSRKLGRIHNELIVAGLVRHGGTGLDGSTNLESALYGINTTLAHLRRERDKIHG